jgi:uncharacterized protein YegL
MLLDSSGSIGSTNWQTIVNGVADALENPDCFPQDDSVELTVLWFGSTAQVIVGPTVVNAGNVAGLAATIRGTGWDAGGTDLTAGFNLATTTLSGSPNFDPALRQVVNVVTDGDPNNDANAVAARDNMITVLGMTTDQDEIDAEAIGSGPDINYLQYSIVYPQPGNIAPPFVPGWVRQVANATEFAETVCEKFQQIEPPQPVGGTTFASDLSDLFAPWMIAVVALGVVGGLAAVRVLAFRRHRA